MAADTGSVRATVRQIALLVGVAIIVSSCSAVSKNSIQKVVLLAPFEGQYSEIGYNALHSLRLAFADAQPEDVQLLAIDEGGAVEMAVARIQALQLDPAVAAIISMGPAATHPLAQQANNKPMIIIGNWGHDRADDDSLLAANRDLVQAEQAGDLLMLSQVRDLVDDLDQVSFASSGAIPDDDFTKRYLRDAPSAPPPNLLASLAYDIANLVLSALDAGAAIAETSYSGLNGLIQFDDEFLTNAPSYRYRYVNGELALATG